MSEPTPQPPARPLARRVIAPSALTLIAALICFGGSLGVVLDSRSSSARIAAEGVEPVGSASGWAEKRYPPEIYEPILASTAPGDARSGGDGSRRGDAIEGHEAEPYADDAIAKPAAAPADLDERLITVGPGDTLSGVLNEAGVSRADGLAALEALRPLFDPRGLRAGETIAVAMASGGDDKAQDRLFRLSIALDARRRAIVSRSGDTGFKARVHDLATVRTPVRAEGVIASSLYAAADRAAVPESIVGEMIRAFSYDIDFQRDLRDGDRFSLMFEQIRATDGTVLEPGGLLYARMVVGGDTHSLYRHVGQDGAVDYYTADGSSVRTALLRTPVNGARLSSGYGMRRHPVLRYSRMHRGIDFAAPIGTPIYAAGDGRIEVLGRNAGYGNYIRIDHRGGYATAYAHLSRFARGLKRGSTVRQGEVIGYVGNTGLSTGPHLHYEILVDGEQVDPLDVKIVRQAHLDDAEMARFAATRASIDRDYARLGGIGAVASTTGNSDRGPVAR